MGFSPIELFSIELMSGFSLWVSKSMGLLAYRAVLHRACVGLFSTGVKKYGLFPGRTFLHRACVGLSPELVGLFSMGVKKYGLFSIGLVLGFSL